MATLPSLQSTQMVFYNVAAISEQRTRMPRTHNFPRATDIHQCSMHSTIHKRDCSTGTRYTVRIGHGVIGGFSLRRSTAVCRFVCRPATAGNLGVSEPGGGALFGRRMLLRVANDFSASKLDQRSPVKLRMQREGRG